MKHADLIVIRIVFVKLGQPYALGRGNCIVGRGTRYGFVKIRIHQQLQCAVGTDAVAEAVAHPIILRVIVKIRRQDKLQLVCRKRNPVAHSGKHDMIGVGIVLVPKILACHVLQHHIVKCAVHFLLIRTEAGIAEIRISELLTVGIQHRKLTGDKSVRYCGCVRQGIADKQLRIAGGQRVSCHLNGLSRGW